MLRRPADRNRPLTPPRIAFFEDRSLAHRISAHVVIAAVMLLYRIRFHRVRRALGGIVLPDDVRRYQLARRYALGATAGFLASRYSLEPDGTLKDYLMHADVFGHWSSFLITADAAMDSKGLSRATSTDLLIRCYHALFEPAHAVSAAICTPALVQRYADIFGMQLQVPLHLPAYPQTEEFRFENFAIAMASIVGKRLAAIADRHRSAGLDVQFSAGLEEFYTRTLNLIAGQLSSLEQMIVDRDHDWGWYRNVLNSKSMDVLLTLLCLFVSPVPGKNPSEKMRKCFYLVNRTFFHRQVLDDLLDVEEDVLSGAANSLVYMVVSQGRIAECCTGDFTARTAEVLREIDRTFLLASEFSVQLDFPLTQPLHSHPADESKYSNATVQALVREALVNRAADRKLPLPELIKVCLLRQAATLEAWAQRDWNKVIAIVKESGIAARILGSITGRKDQAEVESALRDLDDEHVREVMSLFYIRTLRTYEKCLVACQPYV